MNWLDLTLNNLFGVWQADGKNISVSNLASRLFRRSGIVKDEACYREIPVETKVPTCYKFGPLTEPGHCSVEIK